MNNKKVIEPQRGDNIYLAFERGSLKRLHKIYTEEVIKFNVEKIVSHMFSVTLRPKVDN